MWYVATKKTNLQELKTISGQPFLVFILATCCHPRVIPEKMGDAESLAADAAYFDRILNLIPAHVYFASDDKIEQTGKSVRFIQVNLALLYCDDFDKFY